MLDLPVDPLFSVRLYVRWYRLRRIAPGSVPTLLHDPDGDRLYVFSNPMDPWGSKARITAEHLEHLVSEAEAQLRKPVGSETAVQDDVRKLA